MLADDAVDADNLASDAVVTASIVDANVTTAKIADANITMAKLANIATDTFIGRTAASAGVPKALSKAEALAILNVADGAQVNVSGDSGNAAIYDNSGTPAFKSGITKAEIQSLLNIEDGATADQSKGDIDDLAEKINMVLCLNEDELSEMGERSYNKYMKSFSYELAMRKYLDIYDA